VRDEVFITVGDWPHDATTGGQGESDLGPEASSEYEKNLVNLVTDLRKDVKAP
jgi:hypothetical protein